MILKILIRIAIAIGITLLVAMVLIFTQNPTEMSGEGGLDFTQQLQSGDGNPAPLQPLRMADGYDMMIRTYGGADNVPLLVLVHGSGWHGLQFDTLAKGLAGVADVVVPDLRGHGTNPGERGDINYIGEYEDDLARMILLLKKPDQKVIMAGHSAGGGFVVRFAGGQYGSMLDGAVLMAPFLKYNAPTMRPDAGGWTNALTRRIIGLSILNSFGITGLNHLPIIQLNMPREVLDGPLGDTATTSYSYRLNTSYGPRSDYLADVAALPPFVLIAGTADEAFVADQYAPTLGAATDEGRYDLLLGANHLDVVDDPRTLGIIKGFLDEF